MGVLNKPPPMFYAVVIALISMLPLIQGQKPPQPTTFVVVALGSTVLDFSWEAVTGDFDNYLIVFFTDVGTPQQAQFPVPVDKTLTKYRYVRQAGQNVNGVVFYTEKGGTRSDRRDPTSQTVVSIAIPAPEVVSETSSTVKVSWGAAPDPAFDIAEYEITLQSPTGIDLLTERVPALAGASHTFQNLPAGSEYVIIVKAFHPAGINIATDTPISAVVWTIPHEPTAGLIYQTSSKTATLTWTAANQPFDYYKLIITPPSGAPRVYQIASDATSYLLDDILAQMKYGFKLQSIVNTPGYRDGMIESVSSDIREVYSALNLNPNLDAITDHGMHLTWDQNTNPLLQKYTITRVDTNGNSVITGDIPAGATSYTFPDLPADGTMYEYILNAYFDGTLQYAGSVLGTTKMPVNVELNGVTSSTATITWAKNIVPNPDGYLVSVISMDGSYTSLIPVTVEQAVGAYTITGLPAGLTYQIGVDAVKNGDRLEIGAIQQPATLETAIRTDVVTTDLIQTSWDIIDGATYSLLLTNTADGTTRQVDIPNSQTDKFVFTGLTPGQTYTIQLTSHLNGQSTDGGAVTETTYPLPPKNIQVTQSASGTDTIVTWSPPDHVYDGYGIKGGAIELPLTPDQTQYTFSNFVDDGSNILLVSTSQDKVSHPGLPLTNYNVALGGATPSSLQVSYDQVQGANGYHILLVNSDGTVQDEQVVAAGGTGQYTFNGLNPSTEYTAVVSATSADGAKRFIGSDTASTIAATVIPPFNYDLTINPVTTTTMGINWKHNAAANFENYRLTVVDVAGQFPARTFTIPAGANPSQLVTGLTPGTEYSIDVSGVANGIVTTVDSARQSTVPEPPAKTIMTHADNKITLDWFPPLNGIAENYVIKYGPYGGTLETVVLDSNIKHYEILQPFDSSQQHKVEIYSSIGPGQELLSAMGSISQDGVPNTFNPTCDPNPCLNNGECRIEPAIGFVCTCMPGFTGNICQTKVVDVVGSCASSPCLNGADCVELQDGIFRCDCLDGYDGIYCQTDINECASTPCLNGGVCTDHTARYQCLCADGWVGRNCETPIDPCISQPCLNGGVCFTVVADNRYVCLCTDNFTGLHCETSTNDCLPNPCLNDGICADGDSSFSCQCADGFMGVTCETIVDTCSSQPCQNNGACTDFLGVFYVCECLDGYSGDFCEIFLDFCLVHNCINGGVCVNGATSFTCNCAGTDFTGIRCETRIDNCVVGICQNGGTCADDLKRPGEYLCTCVPGYIGQNCQTDINECNSNPCNTGICLNEVNRYRCDCSTVDFSGINCETLINACLPINPCLNGGVCTDGIGVGVFTCACQNGFTGATCNTDINECNSNPCNTGICLNEVNRYRCDCSTVDFTGTNCETVINACLPINPCQNGGVCTDGIGVGVFTCACQTGFTGATCNNDPNECLSNPCLNGGICVDGVGLYTCLCALIDFNGQRCENEINQCASAPCINGGVCIDGVLRYTCNCLPGFQGTNCETTVDFCLVHNCVNGVCVNGATGFTCNCAGTDFAGTQCQTQINQCASAPCINGGVCVDGVLRYTCNCLPGFQGTNCETTVDFCLVHNCINGGVCVNGATGFTCNCAGIDFAGTRCETRVDNCAVGICQNGGNCQDDFTRPGAYICTCAAGYTGTNCETNINECVSNPCRNNGVCMDEINRFTCDCSKIDYVGDICQTRVDNCKPLNPCQNQGICQDGSVPGTFICSCLPGFTGDTCSGENNECASAPCQNGGICTDGVNRYTCDCSLTDYSGDQCQTKINDCAPLNPCQNGGVCTDGTVRGDFSCRCVAGYTGKTCTTNIDDCQPNPCQNNGKCNDGVNSFTCDCSGTDFEGTLCETRINDCPAINPCNNGVCVDGTTPRVYTCNCFPGFTGFYCNNQPDECNSNPCLNGGACQDGTNRYTCICDGTDFTGVRCETRIDNCASSPCINGGNCIDGVLRYTCNCNPGFQGNNCEINFNECISRPCLNSGTCQDMNNGYGCTCANGFAGPNCAVNLNECLSNPCQNEGTCRDGANRYTCECLPTFSGLNCETNTDQCINNLCNVQNSVCIDGDNTYTCRCFPGYLGTHCNQEINECLSSPCLNGGTCVDALLHYNCRCTSMFQGVHCEIAMTSSVVITNMAPTRVQGVFSDIMPDNPNAVYEVTVLDSQGNVKEKKEYRRQDVVNGMIGFDFDNLQPSTDYNVRLTVNDGGEVFPLETVNIRTTTICTTNVCNNGGTCIEEATAPLGYLCTCAPGYEGPSCTSDFNECASQPCHNSGFCRNLVNRFECVCTSQWKGTLCTIPVTVNFVTGQTTPQSIQVIWNQPVGTIIPKYEVVLMDTNGGVVTTGVVSQDKIANGAFDFVFHAPQPDTNYISRLYALMDDGTRVELAVITPSSAQICSTGPCENGGVCVDNRASSLGYTCNCRPGYTGENCQSDIDECVSNPCKNNGQCINGINAFSCTCAIGWMGPLCTVPSSIGFSVGDITTSTVQVMWPNIVMEPGTNFYYKIQTTDAAGHTQSQNIQPVPNAGPDYINTYLIPNLLPSTQYEVSLVVVTDNQEHIVGTQVPTTKSVCTELVPCLNGGVCIVKPLLVERYSCICPDGWTGTNCDQDVSECGSNPCQNGGQCLERFLGYICQCSTQYQGLHCQVSTSNILQLTGMTATDAQFTFTPLNNNDVLVYYLSIRDDVTLQEKTQALTPQQVENGVIDQAFFGLTPNNKYTAALSVQMAGESELLHLGQREITTPNACASITCLNNGVCVPGTTPPLYYTCNCVSGFTGPLCSGDENNCAGNPCANGGQCIDRQGSYLCTCLSGFTGQNCEININECASNPCGNRGRCIDGVNSFTCNCFAGYTGTFCSSAIDECASEPCQNGGFCRDDTNRFFCNCSPGFSGVYCQQNIDECASSPCLNNAACIDQVNRYICTCQIGFSGPNCGEAFNNCANNPCMNGGQCRDLQSSYTCSCAAPYSGLRCEIAPDACVSSPCTNGGTCIGLASSYFCLCLARWQGLNCQLAVSPCENLPCRNGGTCVALTTGFRCDCLRGYAGDICDMNIDDCASSPCQGNGVCMDQLNGYVCVCFSGFTGINCVTDTSACNTNPCQNNGFCLATGSQFYCVCGLMWTGRTCEQSLDQQECASNPCLNGGTCLEQFSAFECICMPGFTGTSCERDINECVNLNLCQNGGTCINSIGSYQCICVLGYEGPTCQTLTIRCTVGYCMNGGVCSTQLNAVTCSCIPGFQGTRCEIQINFCAGVTCQNGGQCVSAVNTYNCQCLPGYGGNLCQINVDNCSPNPCNNGGRCQDGVNTATCICPVGYTGNTCLINSDDCSTPNLCLNGGTCVDGLGSYSCRCVAGFTGSRCQTDVLECASNPCLNNGFCIEQVNMYFCQCQVGYQGTRCESQIVIDECLSNPCVNNGQCLDGQNRYTCQCAPGYIGTRCQTDINECVSSPCQNQGRCVDNVNSFSCICQGGYTGSRCSISPCTSHQCQNGGQCVVLAAQNNLGYSCSCPSTHTGSFCQTLIDLDLCRPLNPCMNAGNCVDGVNTYTCVCQPGYTGRICEINIDECASRPCQNGGGCSDGVNNYICQCSSQFTGRQCETRIYFPCQPDPCLNFGTCNVISATLNMYNCICVQGYTGSRCEISPPTLCQRSPCQNGGTCIPQGTTAYRCACLSYYTGQNCQTTITIDPCTSNPCQNGGQCSRSNNGPVVFYSCTCFNGYVGLNCETRPNPCTSNPCLNGGLCALLNNNNFGFFCNCVNGYTGTTCQTANPCISNPCTNGGTCQTQSRQGVIVYFCRCIVGYTGERCTIPPQNPCNSQPCLNGGQCSRNQQDVTTYLCTCSPNYYGNRCELRNDPCGSNPCLNGGRCTSQQNSLNFIYICQCISGYTGIQCSTPPTNPCVSQPCLNGGTCNRINNFQFTCQCSQYYTGSTCGTSAMTPCTVNPCTNGGTCYIASSTFTCVCRPGYSGMTCLVLSVCASNPCLNGGACSQMPTNQNQYRCSCQFGWTGINCNTPLPTACTNNPCLNQGFCIVTGPSSYVCNCRNGYTGNVCNIIVSCNPNPCLNGGVCSTAANNILNPICTCTQSFTGNRCQTSITTPCSNNPCLNGGTCSATGSSSYMCNCPVGYMGANCQTLGACNPSPCVNGGTCMINFNNPSDYFCDCFTGYTGNNCQFASPTPCSSNPCQNGGGCSNVANSRYTCQCRTGYSGTRCTNIVACLSNPCQNNGLCTINNNNPNQFVCSCQPNFGGTFCQNLVPPVNVCTVNPCQNSGACIQDPSVSNGYRCQCTSGYMGTNCNIQVTLCSQPCVNGGNCIFDQTHAVYTCSCSEQFAGTQCQLASSCSAQYTLTEGQEIRITSPNYPFNYMDNLNCLYNIMASSTNRRVSFIIDDLETECDRDIVQIGHGSNPADAASVVMRESGTGLIAPFFVDDSNAWLRFMSDSWQTRKGFSVTVKDVPLAGAPVTECEAGFCANGGMCVIRGDLGSVYCVCRSGYIGDRCETNVDECSSTPCQFGGECRDVINGYICICAGGRQGPNCELATSSQCQGAVCLNGGTCHPVTDGSFVCSCVPQFTGTNCQQTVQTPSSSCQSNPCFNGGQCVNVNDGTFLCICSQSYTGTLCESAVALCARSPPPCFNGGACSDTTGSVVCSCRSGFIGTFCELATQDCICQNGGICFGANNCICGRGFTGQFCEVNINECLSAPCLNGGGCIDGENFFSCVCQTGYSGSTCSFRDPNTAQLSAGDGTNTAASTGETLGIGWIILISVLALLLLLLLIFIALRSWKSYDNQYYEDKNHLTDYEENDQYSDSRPREMEMGNILLPQTGATNVTRLNAQEEPWPVSTDEMPTSNI